jgi:hypothetical protein
MNAVFDFRMTTTTIQFVIDTVGITTNLLIVFLYLTRTQLRAINGFHLMFILALADFLICFGDMMFASRRLIQFFFNVDLSQPIKRYWVMLYCLPHYTGLQLSQITSCIISIERIRAIQFPVHYRNSKHKRNAYVIGVLATIYSIVAILFTNAIASNFNV